MSKTTLTYPTVIRVRHALAIGLTAILILTSLVLIAGAILVIVSSTTQDAYQADLIPVVQNSIIPMAVLVPTPPIAELQPIPSKTPAPASMVAS